MSFVHPNLALAAAALASLPVLIHLLSRRRHRREPWAAMDFVLAAYRRSRRRLQIEQWALLALRTLAILLIGMSVARPYIRESDALAGAGLARADRLD